MPIACGLYASLKLKFVNDRIKLHKENELFLERKKAAFTPLTGKKMHERANHCLNSRRETNNHPQTAPETARNHRVHNELVNGV